MPQTTLLHNHAAVLPPRFVQERGKSLGLPEAPAYADHLTLCDKGVILGKGTVIAAIKDSPGDGAGLVLKGREERILALLSVATNQAIDADVLDKFEAASRALGKSNVGLAVILVAHVGLPPLAHAGMAKALSLAADELDKGDDPFELLKRLDLLSTTMRTADGSPTLRKFNPNHVPAGTPEGGQFCSADQTGVAGLTPKQKEALVAAAKDWSNSKVPYKWGGSTKNGADCSGAVSAIYARAGIDIGRMSSQDFKNSPLFEPATAPLQTGDIGVYSGHVVLYGGNTGADKDVWSASHTGGSVFGPASSSWYGSPTWYRYKGR